MEKKAADGSRQNYEYHVSSDNLFAPLVFGEHRLYQIGRMHMRPGASVDTHTQLNYVELTLVLDGRGVIVTNGHRVPVTAGDIYVSFPGDFHAIESNVQAPLKFDFFTVQTEDPKLHRELESVIEHHHAADGRTIRGEHLRALVTQAMEEINAPDQYSERAVRGIIDQLLTGVLRAFAHKETRQTVDADDREILCIRLMNYIDSHIYTLKSLRQIGEITNYSYNYLSNLFKEVTGDTLLAYYCSRRFEAAALLLKDGRFSVSRVAEMLGYSSVYSFSQAFKKHYGYSPRQAGTNPDGSRK